MKITKSLKRSVPGRIVRRSALTARKLTWRIRTDPDFLIIGVQKGGTTSLHKYLAQHSELASASVKEVHYFCGGLDPEWDKWKEGMRLYRSYMPIRSLYKRRQVFEASPTYIFHPEAAKRIHEVYPQMKLILLLRNPVERAISQYYHEVRNGRETLPLLEALEAEEERLAPSYRDGDYKRMEWARFSYFRRGLYAEQIQEYLRYFDRDALLVRESEELFRDPRKVVDDVCSFLGVRSQSQSLDLSPKGVGVNRVETSEVDAARTMLKELYRVPNQDLVELLQMNFSWVSD